MLCRISCDTPESSHLPPQSSGSSFEGAFHQFCCLYISAVWTAVLRIQQKGLAMSGWVLSSPCKVRLLFTLWLPYVVWRSRTPCWSESDIPESASAGPDMSFAQSTVRSTGVYIWERQPRQRSVPSPVLRYHQGRSEGETLPSMLELR